jgi:dolichol kinase
VEINRDIVQILLGIAVIAIAVLFPYLAAISIIFALILLAYTSNNLIANLRMGRFYTRAMDLERRGATYGQGAIYLAASTALVIAFAHNFNFLLFGIVILFFADSFATIVGVSSRRAAQLPYNRNKTIIGTLTFLVIAAVAGYFLLGLIGILFAFILAFIESLSLSIDDNIRSGIVMVVLRALTGI